MKYDNIQYNSTALVAEGVDLTVSNSTYGHPCGPDDLMSIICLTDTD